MNQRTKIYDSNLTWWSDTNTKFIAIISTLLISVRENHKDSTQWIRPIGLSKWCCC